MIWCSVSSLDCHLLTFTLLSSKTFGLVWGINWYYNIVQASCRDQFQYSFSFCLFTTQFSGGREDPLVVHQGMCVIHAGSFFKHLQWWPRGLQLFRAQRYVAGCFSLLSSSPLQGCVECPSTTQGRPLQSSVAARTSGSIPIACCCRADVNLHGWEADCSRQTG